MATIIDITADYPDALAPHKTPAVQRLITLDGENRHRIYSLNRSHKGPGREIARDGDLITLRYFGLPMGLLLRPSLYRLAARIIRDIEREGIRPDYVFAHKLTIDGIVAARVARHFGCPYYCAAWGNTDRRLVRFKPELRGLYRRIVRESAGILCASPWIGRYLVDTLGLSPDHFSNLPVVVAHEGYLAPQTGNGRLLTVFNLDTWRIKGLANLLAAMALLKQRGRRVELDVVGGARKVSMSELEALVAAHGVQGQVNFLGTVDNSEITTFMNGYSGYVMPSLFESYGMVFIEALFASVPILYPKERAIDGYFDEVEVGFRADPESIDSIAAGIEHLLDHEAALKGSIAHLQAEGFFEQFKSSRIAEAYQALFHRA